MFHLFKKTTDPLQAMSVASNLFTDSVYWALCKGNLGRTNLVFCGFSLHTVLGMLASGARDSTLKEILNELILDDKDSNENRSKKFSDAMNGFVNGRGEETFTCTIELASKVYCSKNLRLNPAFASAFAKNFKSAIEQLDFDDLEAAAKKVNAWVASTTHQMIKEVVNANSLTEDIRLLLVNAVFFKQFWEEEFDERLTKDRSFFINSKEKVPVKMMTRTGWMDYVELKDIKAQALRLPYKNRYSMIIVLPRNKDNGLAGLQTWGHYYKNGKSRVIEKLNRHEVHLYLPRFRVETTINDMPSALKHLGMNRMFSEDEAEFGGIVDPMAENQEKAYVSSIIEKAIVEVDEKGAAVTAAKEAKLPRTSLAAPSEIIQFYVDRPFYFEIVDHDNGNRVLLSGHCVNPTVI